MAHTHSNPKQAGRIAPDFSLPGVDGNTYTLANFDHAEGLVVTFTCNHCPVAKAGRPVLQEFATRYDQIAFVAISASDADAFPADSFENMKVNSEELGLSFPYLYDENQSVAHAYDAQCTPDNYLFKKNGDQRELFFHGRLTDNWKRPRQAKKKDLEDNIQRLISKQEPGGEEAPSIGCSLKWKA